MRSNEERVVEVKRRIEQKKRKDKLQRSRMVMALAVAASLICRNLPGSSVQTAIHTMR